MLRMSNQIRSQSRAPYNLHLQQLAYLREVERSATWGEAATRLHVSQPALSQALAELERRLGVALFERVGRRKRLTSAGREAAAFAQRVLSDAADLQARLQEVAGGAGGDLRVGMIDAASLYILPSAVGKFRQSHPGVRLELTVESSGGLLTKLRNLQLDLAFVTGPRHDADLQLNRIYDEPMYLYGPTARPTEESDWVLYPRGSQTRDQIDAGLESAGYQPRVILESGNPQVLRQLVALGLGWSVLPAAVAESRPASLERRRKRAVSQRSLLAARRAGAPDDARADAFLELARRAARR